MTATDNCDTDVEVTFDETIIPNDCGSTIVRTWTATDNCGNSVSASQTISTSDSEEPTLAGVPANVTADCDDIPTPASPTATDNCDTEVEITFDELTTPGLCTESYTLTRTWTATDDCGNTMVESQTITVEDNTAPELVGVPADVTSDCVNVPTPPAPGIVTATDNCDTDVEVTFDETIIPNDCGSTIVRTWTA
ncbi:MAG: gliding motility-associated C-terminal domain-containing protein, partial [Sulfitobacter sp.]|nr:gliding motility-associated C-terminal domain-containing protein [Sulfitobacter sp.]